MNYKSIDGAVLTPHEEQLLDQILSSGIPYAGPGNVTINDLISRGVELFVDPSLKAEAVTYTMTREQIEQKLDELVDKMHELRYEERCLEQRLADIRNEEYRREHDRERCKNMHDDFTRLSDVKRRILDELSELKYVLQYNERLLSDANSECEIEKDLEHVLEDAVRMKSEILHKKNELAHIDAELERLRAELAVCEHINHENLNNPNQDSTRSELDSIESELHRVLAEIKEYEERLRRMDANNIYEDEFEGKMTILGEYWRNRHHQQNHDTPLGAHQFLVNRPLCNDDSCPCVVLYINNIRKCSDADISLTSTFVHEYAHAYYDHNHHFPDHYNKYVEEPLTELAMLYYMQTYDPIHVDRYLANVKAKQASPACCNYGFGAYLFLKSDTRSLVSKMYRAKYEFPICPQAYLTAYEDAFKHGIYPYRHERLQRVLLDAIL